MAENLGIDKSALYFEVGKEYKDTGTVDKTNDQFMRWINLKNSGMRNMGGIRWLKTKSPSREGSDGIILLTNHASSATHNPWDDEVNHHIGNIQYWGDAKHHQSKSLDDFEGNKNLRRAFDTKDRALKPFILHFTKERKGWVRFNGLCILNSLHIEWFQDNGTPVQNYRASLIVLDCPKVNIQWLEDWRSENEISKRLSFAPQGWVDYVKRDIVKPMRAWDVKILDKKRQMPEIGSVEFKALDQLMQLNGYAFERLVTSLIRTVGRDLIRDLVKTKDRADGGFDFFGRFILPSPFGYEISFKGEVKRHKGAINPVQVSRLVARLGRGEYGIFITTSYYTPQAQSEIYEMNYPVSLVYGNKLIEMVKHTPHWKGDRICDTWISSFEDE